VEEDFDEETGDYRLIRIAIVGPESTGKSTLSAQLASYFNTQWVPEVARQYIAELDRPYTAEDVLEISKMQIAMEDELANKAKQVLFCDTNLLVTKIWMLHAYKYCHSWIEREMEQRKYDLCLLTNIDLPWEPDPQREHPHLREYLFNWYKKELEESKEPFVIVSGAGDQRFHFAVRAITKRFPDLKINKK
jgi:NadR type nicotinamide-nucleotide adenylyltransferase